MLHATNTRDRRDFLKTAALAAATAVAKKSFGAPAARASDLPDSSFGLENLKWDKAPCRFCGTGCHVRVGVDANAGKVVAIQGDPLADVNKGLLCVKGYHVGGILYGKDRLTRPLLRRGDAYEPISWDEAIDLIGKKIMAAPERFGFYGSGQWTIPEGYAAQKLMKAGLSNNHIDPNARLCMASAVTGFLSVYGVDEPAGCYQDLDECDVCILWGNNPAEMHPVLFSRLIDRRSRGQKVLLIDIGTRRTRTTEQADHFLEMAPQGDLAIANGILHLLLENGTYDKEFVEKHCAFRKDSDPPVIDGVATTFEEFKAALAPYTPEHAAELAGLKPDDIRMLAELFGRRDMKITSLWCMGMNQHTQGTAINSLVHAVHLLSGHFGKPGDAPTSLTGQPSACGTVREVGTLSHALPGGRLVAKDDHRKQCEELWNLPAGRINAKPGLHTVKLFESFCTPNGPSASGDKGGEIDVLWVQVTNPGQSLPNLGKLFDKKKGLKDKFLIVSDVYPTATTQLADLILPSAMWVEKNGMYGNSERRTQQWFKMVNPPGDARDDAWQTIAVARKLFDLGHPGMKDKDGKFLFDFGLVDAKGAAIPIWQWEHYYDANVDRALFEEYRRFTTMKHKNLAPYDEYVKARGLRWPVMQQKDGSWRETRYRFSEFDDPNVKPGTGIQFYHSTSHDDRAQIWFRPYVKPPEMPDADFPMWLCTGRVLEHWHTGTMTRRVPELRRAMPRAYVELNPEDAKALAIQNGEIVRVESRRGHIDLPAWIDGRGRPPKGSVFVPFFDETSLINECTLEANDFFSKQPDYKKCAVRVSRVARVATQ